MSEFAFLYHDSGAAATAASPEQRQQTLEKWVAWFKDLGAEGHVKEMGHPLVRSGKLVSGKQKTVNDGPFAETKDVIGGFSVIEATDIAQAAELAKGCPILEVGGAVEVRPIQQMSM
jgi:hypothetical protein